MIQVQQQKSLAAWIGPIAAFLLLVGGGWFLVWFWHGIDTSGTIVLSPETTAALMGSGSAPAAAAAAAPSGPSIAALQIPGKGTIAPSSSSSWAVTAEPYVMHIQQIPGPPGFEFNYTIRRNAAFKGADNSLVGLAVQLMFNPMIQHQSGASPDLIQKLRDTFGRQLMMPPFKMADADAQIVEALWPQYVSAGGSGQQDAGAKLLDALADAGNKSMAANQDSFSAIMTSLRAIIPPEKEKELRDNIHAGTVRPLTESHPAGQ